MTTSWRFAVLILSQSGRAGAGHVSAVGPLGHDAFEALSLRFLVEFCPEGLAVTAECNQLMARQDCLEPLFAFKQRKSAQILPIVEHKVEHAVEKLRLVTERVLQQLEMRNPVLV